MPSALTNGEGGLSCGLLHNPEPVGAGVVGACKSSTVSVVGSTGVHALLPLGLRWGDDLVCPSCGGVVLIVMSSVGATVGMGRGGSRTSSRVIVVSALCVVASSGIGSIPRVVGCNL